MPPEEAKKEETPVVPERLYTQAEVDQQIQQVIQFITMNPQVLPKKPRNKVGRNEPCPCESGLKYKKCCSIKKVIA
jgi:uncharacterized protein YecA (UPF0149 family)